MRLYLCSQDNVIFLQSRKTERAFLEHYVFKDEPATPPCPTTRRLVGNVMGRGRIEDGSDSCCDESELELIPGAAE